MDSGIVIMILTSLGMIFLGVVLLALFSEVKRERRREWYYDRHRPREGKRR